MGKIISLPGTEDPLEVPPPGPRTTATSANPLRVAVVSGRILISLLSMSGVSFRPLMYAEPTGSNQTVCQMPLVDVYQMLLGLRTCFPRGCVPASVGSQAETTNSLGPEEFMTSVISKLNPSYPPRWSPWCTPLTHTWASKSTASKWSSTRRPCQLPGT